MSKRGGPHPAAAVLAAINMPVAYYCGGTGSVGCGAPLRRPGQCEGCEKAERDERRGEDIRQRIKARVPATYRWGTLETSGQLHKAMANPSLLGDVRSWLEDRASPPILLLRGETHSLKSTVAAACIQHETLADRDAFFVLAVDCVPLPDKAPQERVELYQTAMSRLRRRVLVAVDDIAKVLGGAPGESPIAAYRRGELCAALHRRWQAREKTIITTDLENRIGPCAACDARGIRRVGGPTCGVCKGLGKVAAPGIVECFGEDILARLTDEQSAVVVRLERRH